jgi:hypothetical protein
MSWLCTLRSIIGKISVTVSSLDKGPLRDYETAFYSLQTLIDLANFGSFSLSFWLFGISEPYEIFFKEDSTTQRQLEDHDSQPSMRRRHMMMLMIRNFRTIWTTQSTFLQKIIPLNVIISEEKVDADADTYERP